MILHMKEENPQKKKKLDTSLTAIDISPIKLHVIAQHQKLSTAKHKLQRVCTRMEEEVANIYKVNIDNLIDRPPLSSNQQNNDKKHLI